MKHFRLIGDDDQAYYVSREDGDAPPAKHKGKPSPVEVPRMPNDFEDWDAAKGAFVKNHAAAADHAVGPEAIAKAHAQKAIEALLLKAGIDIDGILSAEAKALKLPKEELADKIIERSKVALANEVKRRIEKNKGDKS